MTQRKLVFLLWVSVGLILQRAEAHSVTIRRPAERDAPTAEVATRLRGELLAMGARAEVVTAARLASTRAHAGADAVMQVMGSATMLRVEIWLRLDSDELVSWMTLEQSRLEDNAPEKLAIRAAEAFHSRFVQVGAQPLDELEERAKRQSKPPATDAATPRDEPRPTATPSATPAELGSRRPRLALGAAALVATRGLGPALMPIARFEWPLWEAVVPYVTLAGLGSQSHATTDDGGVRVGFGYGLLGVNYYAGTLGSVQPFMGVGVGGLYTSIQGRAQPPLSAHASKQGGWLAELTLGALMSVSPLYYFSIAGHAQWTTPTTVVHVLDDIVAISGRPNWGGSLTAGIRL